MFGGLKEKLQAARSRLGSSIQTAIGTPAGDATAGAQQEPLTEQEKPAVSSATPEKPTLVDKFRVFIIERELIVSEKDVSDALAELEMTLLESDVALPATDAIIANVRKSLVGKHRKIGESVDSLVVGALKVALLDVLGNGFNLLEYIRSHPDQSDPVHRRERDRQDHYRCQDRFLLEKTGILRGDRCRRYLPGRCY